jgi:hypothetical protein
VTEPDSEFAAPEGPIADTRPSKRPDTVTAASWMLLVVAIVSAVVLGLFAVRAIRDLLHERYSVYALRLPPDAVVNLLWMLGLLTVSILAIPLIRRGHRGIRLLTLAYLGGSALKVAHDAIYAVARLPFGHSSANPSSRVDLAGTGLQALAVAFLVATIGLLVGPTASGWFHRSDRPRWSSSSTSPRRPGSATAAWFLSVVILLTNGGFEVWWAIRRVQHIPSYRPQALGLIAPALVSSGIILLIFAVACVLLLFGNDIARYCAVAFGGYFVFFGVLNLVTLLDVAVKYHITLTFAGVLICLVYTALGVLGAIAAVLLSRPAAAHWFHSRRFPTPEGAAT